MDLCTFTCVSMRLFLASKVKEEANFKLNGVDVKFKLSRMIQQRDVKVQVNACLISITQTSGYCLN